MANFQKIKTIASEKGITLSELAERVNMTPTGLGILIKSPRAMTNNVEAIARELGVRVGVFFDEDGQTAANNAAEQSELLKLLAQKDAIIAQKDEIIAQKDAVINILTKNIN